LVKDTAKKTFFSNGIKELEKRWNRCVEVEGNALKSDISFVSVYLQ
jgi:hypothetical protein